MPTKILEQAKVITPRELKALRFPIPQSWIKAAGILKGKKKVNALAYQKQIRKAWDRKLAKLENL